MDTTNDEKMLLTAQVTARAGDKHIERIVSNLERKERIREARRKARLAAKGY